MSLETRRIKLQGRLEEILGNNNVYFQPPSSISLKYPCIIYSYEDLNRPHAGNKAYLDRDRYSVILVTKDPLPEAILTLLDDMPYTSFDRHYASDNLHHFAYTTHLLEGI